jgi:alkylation response protein AidB-like acyl-CoA dehydrogenase
MLRENGGAHVARPDGLRTPLVYFPRSQVTLHDNWDVGGMRGTGSVDYEVDDAFVPEGRWVPFPMSGPVVDEPLYRLTPIAALAAGVAHVCLGLAARAVDEIVRLAGEKTPTSSTRTLAERPAVQAKICEAEAAQRSARSFLREAVEACSDEAASSGSVSDESRRRLRLAANNAAERSAHAVDVCYLAGGGSSIWRSSPLLRVFRDMHVATQHGAVSPSVLEVLGRMRLGLTTDLTSI